MKNTIIHLDAIEHHAFDNYCYPLDQDNLVINLRTGKEVEKVYILWGDPFDWGPTNNASNYNWKYTAVEVTEKKELQEHLWWTITLQPKFKRCKYFFNVHAGSQSYIYGESGLVDESSFHKQEDAYYPFIFPWMNKNDIANPPKWAEDTIWYQIFPSRFRRGPIAKKHGKLLPWADRNTIVNNEQKYGGNLNGVTEKLDYLADLGITGIYLNPVNCSTTQHKYDTTDYFDIDPEFGTKEDMKRLVAEAHKRGIKIMLDGVFNHSSWDFFAWQDVVKNRENSKYKDWYMVNEWDFTDRPSHNADEGKIFAFAYCDYMPKFNTNNPEVRKYLIDACEFWAKEYDIDALRLDVANEVCHDFCRELRQRMLSLKSDFYIIGEIWHNSIPWLRGNEFDSIMNYPLQNAIYNFALTPGYTTRAFEQNLNRCLTDYFQQTQKVMFNLMDSHDTMRLATRAGGREKSIQMLAIMFAMPGSPCFYYGTEVFLEGGKDPDCRRCMPWDEIEAGKCDADLNLFKQLIYLRKTNDAMASMDMEFIHIPGKERLLCFIKKSDSNKLVLLANYTGAKENISGYLDGTKVVFASGFNAQTRTLDADGVIIAEKSL